MIPYHGGPLTPMPVAVALWRRRHAFVSFAHPAQVWLAASLAQSFALDNGAFTLWKSSGGRVDVAAYAQWVRQWERHPGFDWAVIPDVIDGSEQENDDMIRRYGVAGGDLDRDVPVWHLHESIDRLARLAEAYPRVALGSSGEWSTPNTKGWWFRIGNALEAITDADGRPVCRLHGLRMLDPEICARLPLASADSTNVARNIGLDRKWTGPYVPTSKEQRALVIADRIEHAEAADRWQGTGFVNEMNWDLFGAAAQ